MIRGNSVKVYLHLTKANTKAKFSYLSEQLAHKITKQVILNQCRFLNSLSLSVNAPLRFKLILTWFFCSDSILGHIMEELLLFSFHKLVTLHTTKRREF